MIELQRERLVRIGHRGAAALAPENTLRSLGCALELGVDLVEFDVLDLADGSLVLAHSDDLLEVSHGAARGTVRARSLAELRRVAPELPTFDEALSFLAERGAGAGVHVDVKWHGYEERVLEALRAHRLLERALLSSWLPRVVRRLRALGAGAPLGLAYPTDRRGLADVSFLTPFVPGVLATLRRSLPWRIGGLLKRAGADVAVLHHGVVSRAAVDRCHARGVPVVAWTVDDPALLSALAAMGVDAVVTNDPRIFGATLTP